MEGVNAADVGVLLALICLVVRLEWTRSENAAAHDAITRNINGVRRERTKGIGGVKHGLTKDIDGVKQELNGLKQDVNRKIDDLKRDLTKDIDGVKQELNGLKQEVKKLLTGDVAWMQAVLQDRRRRE